MKQTSAKHNHKTNTMKHLIACNWKMNPLTQSEAKKLHSQTVKLASETKRVEYAIAAPHVYIQSLAQGNKKCMIGAQNIHSETSGAYTGDVSASQIKSCGARFTIIGHSERRRNGETDTDVQKKIDLALKNNLSVILCVGEDDRDEHGIYLSRVKSQIETGLAQIKKSDLIHITIAYEPVWAIGSKAVRPATPAECEEMIIYIRRVLTDMFDATHVEQMRILYGGSADSKTVASYMTEGLANGFLLGRASLDIKELKLISKIISEIK